MIKTNTNNPIYDFYIMATKSRNRHKKDIIEHFEKAYTLDETLAIRTLFCILDKTFLGERRVVEICFHYLAFKNPTKMKEYLKYIPIIGRWSSLFVFFHTPLEQDMLKVIKTQLEQDLQGDKVSLLAMDIPSMNSKSKGENIRAKLIANHMHWDYSTYRKKIAFLREKLRNNKEDELAPIKYDNDDMEVANILLDYGLCHTYKSDENDNTSSIHINEYNETIEKRFIDYCNKTNEKCKNDVLVVPNLSSAIFSTNNLGENKGAASIIGTAFQFSHNNKGYFHNKLMSFSENPTYISFNEKDTLFDCVSSLDTMICNVNLDKLYELVLTTIKRQKLKFAPNILIISNTPFNRNVENSYLQSERYDTMAKEYAKYNLAIPNIVYWNVDCPYSSYSVLTNKKGIHIANGCSNRLLDEICEYIDVKQEDYLLDKLHKEPYICIN